MSEARPDPFYNVFTTLDECCPGVVMTMDIENGLLLAYQANAYRPLSCAQVQAVVGPLIAEGNPPQYQAAPAPPRIPKIMPGATPVLAPPPRAPTPPVPPAPGVKGVTAGDGLLVNGMAGATITETGIISLDTPLSVARGGTGTGFAGGHALDNISGFAATGYVQRTGPAGYAIGPLPPAPPAVTAITAGNGLTGGTITNAGTIALASPVAVANGGTGLAAGTPGGVAAFTGAATLASSAALTAGALVKGGAPGVPAASTAWSEDGGRNLTANFNTAPGIGASANGLYVLGPDNGPATLTLEAYNSLGQIIARRAQGTAAAPAPLTDDLSIVALLGGGYDGAWNISRAQLSVNAAEAWASGANGSKLKWFTTARGSTAMTFRGGVQADGTLYAGSNASSNAVSTGAGTVNAQSGYYLNQKNVTPGTLQVAQTSPANPTGTANTTTGVMMGLAGAITPQATSRVKISISGDIFNATAVGDGASAQIRWGTGTAPANGAAPAGTAVGAKVQYIAATTAQKTPFSLSAIVTGLAAGTAYWIDLALTALTGGTANVENLSITAFEL